VNLSSPNTPGLRELQDKAPLTKIIKALLTEREQKAIKRPILLKIAPDLSEEQISDVIEIVIETGIEGVIATNTTISREGLQEPKESLHEIGNGGLSGKPLRQRANDVVKYIHQQNQSRFTIVGVGGIDSVESALERLHSGADLIQVYSGLIYQGPHLIKKVKKALLDQLSK
jgi:dihydroorotate dehydrogenase